MLRDAYVHAFSDLVKQTREHTGIELPEHVECYVVLLLADHVEKIEFLPNKTFAESFLSIQTARDAKAVGDACLFTAGVFPGYRNTRYISDLGISAYSQVRKPHNEELFETMARGFAVIRNFINHAVRRADEQFSSGVL